MTPESIRLQMAQVGREQSKAHDAIQQLEIDAERAEILAQSLMDKTFLTSEGNIEEKKALAREKALEARDAAVIARAKYNRAKMKSKFLENESMRLQSILKSVQLEGA